MKDQGEKKEFLAPEELIQFIVDTRDGRFNGTANRTDIPIGRMPNYHQPTEPVYLHGIR